ncbi:hypothetical protein ANN_00685 [Periplaneta americana]|uniref:Uncharacterized protein n=1 Tax=Periplaneta americana TaxID=6978 RepID=A0ABQ8TT96_PERAM|nr:hypothetical protein ANN_00685 [Periplaneta americana]
MGLQSSAPSSSGISVRTVTLCSSLLATVLIQAYSATLVSHIAAVTQQEPPFQDLHGLLHSRYSLAVVKGSYIHSKLQEFLYIQKFKINIIFQIHDLKTLIRHCDKTLKALQNEIIYILRLIDKKKIVFYKNKTAALPVYDEFQKLWRSVAVESMDDLKIEEYLEKQGNMQDHGPKKPIPHKRRNLNQCKKQSRSRKTTSTWLMSWKHTMTSEDRRSESGIDYLL